MNLLSRRKFVTPDLDGRQTVLRGEGQSLQDPVSNKRGVRTRDYITNAADFDYIVGHSP